MSAFGDTPPTGLPPKPVGRNWKLMSATTLAGGAIISGFVAWAMSSDGKPSDKLAKQPSYSESGKLLGAPEKPGYEPPAPPPEQQAAVPPALPPAAAKRATPHAQARAPEPKPDPDLESVFAMTADPAVGGSRSAGGRGIASGPRGEKQEQLHNTMDRQNGFASKSNWQNSQGSNGSPYLSAWQAAPDGYIVRAMTLIPVELVHDMNTDNPGEFGLQVTQMIFDTKTGTVPLIPPGSIFQCVYNSQVSYGQSRIQNGCHTLIFPDDSSVDIGFMNGTDSGGADGFEAEVNRHGWSMAGAIALNVFSKVAGQAGQLFGGGKTEVNIGSTGMDAAGDTAGDITSEIARRELDRANTLTRTHATSGAVKLNKSLVLPEWSE